MSSTVETATEIRAFHVEISEEQIDELRRRIAATRWPSKELVADRSLERRARLPRQDRRHKRLEPSHQIPLVAGMRAPRGSIAKVLE